MPIDRLATGGESAVCRWQQRRLEDNWALQMIFRTGMQMVEWKLLNSHLPLDRCRALDALISARKGAAAAVGRQSVGGACGAELRRRFEAGLRCARLCRERGVAHFSWYEMVVYIANI